MSGLLNTKKLDKEPIEKLHKRFKRGKVLVLVSAILLAAVVAFVIFTTGSKGQDPEAVKKLMKAMIFPIIIMFSIPVLVLFGLKDYISKREAAEDDI